MVYIDWSEIFLYLILSILVILAFHSFDNWVNKNTYIQQEVIKQSNDYIIYKECIKIEDYYYCKGLVD